MPHCSRAITLCLLVLLSALAIATAVMSMPGAPKAVDGAANSAEVESIAKFAVDEHNKKQNSALRLVSVVSASKQVVAGVLTRVRLMVAEGEGGAHAEYEASVWEKPWEGFKELQSFEPVAAAE
eukprot:TRINITY_DN46611_c0_g1_i1.p2 TRINITY_DN46611_c0_g1~~TRINITY_DN46611_c0_g1_i1.p2  ORF type:complete len:124 (+),score=11.94 TRINITY_DN46611_c0_g1_i1:59-430(+)